MSIGQQLREAREQRSLSLDDAALVTHIRTHYLEALEADDLGIFPSMVQVRGFLRAYSRYLQLDPEKLLAELEGVPAVAAVLPAPPSVAQPPVMSEKDLAMQQVEAIFVEVGQKLVEHREVLGLSLQDVERQTHIRVHYLRALEEGDLRGLPSPVQGRGMLSNYASFLGLDPDPLLLRYADGLQAGLAAKRSEQRDESLPSSEQIARRPSSLRRILSTDFIVGGLLVVFLIAFTAWGTLRISAMIAGNEPSPTAPSIADVLLNSAAETLTSTPSEVIVSGTPEIGSEVDITTPEPLLPVQGQVGAVTQTVTATITLPVIGEGPLQVSLITLQRAWMRVTVDGEILFEGRIMPGGAYSYSGDDRIEVLTGNGAALRFYFNQQDLGVLGSLGEVILRVFTIEGIQTPTATLTPTGLPIPTSTITPPGETVSTPTLGP
jgi:cytoskeleton protein RodZ